MNSWAFIEYWCYYSQELYDGSGADDDDVINDHGMIVIVMMIITLLIQRG